ncbi:MAG: ImmA/IrrE family metallo-endopeptidase [Clostridia bacterium]|nr:ImmA/IrrE family metallo-endopeptidase [Clostridia bacterium]
MFDEDKVGGALLTKKKYAHIEKKVVDLYVELDLSEHPLNPFAIAKYCGYVVVPYSLLHNEAVELLREKEMDGISYFNQADNLYYIGYDDSEVVSRQYFTIMHEIGHIRLGHKEDSALADKEADYFAAYSLAPSPIMEIYECEDFVDIKLSFGVSESCAVRCFDRFIKWELYGGKLKDYEKRLLKLFEKN